LEGGEGVRAERVEVELAKAMDYRQRRALKNPCLWQLSREYAQLHGSNDHHSHRQPMVKDGSARHWQLVLHHRGLYPDDLK
jgi:hypothetical protein